MGRCGKTNLTPPTPHHTPAKLHAAVAITDGRTTKGSLDAKKASMAAIG